MATLGITYRPMGLLKEARDIGSHVLEARRRILGDKHPDTFTSMTYVAAALRASGNYAAAVKLETEKLEGWTKLRGPSHPETLEAMAGLAWALACQGHYARAAQPTTPTTGRKIINFRCGPCTAWLSSLGCKANISRPKSFASGIYHSESSTCISSFLLRLKALSCLALQRKWQL
jgi:hypothetical protein